MDNNSPITTIANVIKILLAIASLVLIFINGKWLVYVPLVFSLILIIVIVEAVIIKEISIRTFTISEKDNSAMFYSTIVAFVVLIIICVSDFVLSLLKMGSP